MSRHMSLLTSPSRAGLLLIALLVAVPGAPALSQGPSAPPQTEAPSASPVASADPCPPPDPAPSGAPDALASAAPESSASASPSATPDPCALAEAHGELRAAYVAEYEQFMAAAEPRARRIDAAQTFPAFRRAWARMRDLQRSYARTIAALSWPDAIRPDVNEWKRLQDDLVAAQTRLARARNNRQLDRLYDRTDRIVAAMEGPRNRIRDFLGLPPLEAD